MEIRQFADINAEIAAIRREVFIEEQGVSPAEEYEGYEDRYTHFCLYDGDTLAGYLRVIQEQNILRIGRVAVRKAYRRQGLGSQLMAAAEAFGASIGCTTALLHAQTQAQAFYSALGYLPSGDLFFEANIEHVRMAKSLSAP
jgi:predicted GNAT family N-acyltransferase